MIELSKENFEKEVMDGNVPVLIDFYADWCGPCKMIAPVIEEIDIEYDDKVKVCKVNIDDEAEIAASFGVTSIPTVIVLKDGQIIGKNIGFAPKSKIEEMFSNLQ